MRPRIWAAAIALSLASGASYASLIGDEIRADLLQSGAIINGPNGHMVGPGAEGSWFGEIEYDLDDSTITVSSLFGSGVWLGNLSFDFSDLDWVGAPTGEIIGASVVSTSGARVESH